MGKFKGPNAKQQAGRDKKAANAAVKQAAADRTREATEAQEWKKGSNVRGATKSAAAAQKADEAARKRAEKAALLAAEEEADGNIKPKKIANSSSSNTKKKKKKATNTELSLLEETLVGDAEKKSKAAKRAERLKKEREERLRQEREQKRAKEVQHQDPLLANTDAMIGSVTDHNGGEFTLNAPLNANEAIGTGIDSALSALSVGNSEEQHPEKRMKALHLAFEEKLMPEIKRDYPGLKRSQYKEKIFAIWKKSPENPMNWHQQSC